MMFFDIKFIGKQKHYIIKLFINARMIECFNAIIKQNKLHKRAFEPLIFSLRRCLPDFIIQAGDRCAK